MCLIPTKRNARSALFVFVFIFIFEWLFHGKFLQGLYQTTSQLWRTPAEFKEYFNYMIVFQAAFSLWVVSLFDAHFENKGMDEGARFGILLGTGLALLSFGPYLYLPISLDLGLTWAVGGFIEGLGIGMVLGHFHQSATGKKKKK